MQPTSLVFLFYTGLFLTILFVPVVVLFLKKPPEYCEQL